MPPSGTRSAALCRRRGCWLIYNAAMERIVFDGRPVIHPAALEGIADARHHGRLGVQGVADDRLAGRLGGRAASGDGATSRARTCSTSVTPVSLTQAAAVAALRTPDDDAAAAVAEWQRRAAPRGARLAPAPAS